MTKEQARRIKTHVCTGVCWKRCNYANDIRDGMPFTPHVARKKKIKQK